MWSKSLEDLKTFEFELLKNFVKDRGVIQAEFSRGYKFFIEGFVHDIWNKSTETHIIVRAKCYRSQRKTQKPHNLQITCLKGVTTAGDQSDKLVVQECHCSCDVGQSESCHHVIALGYWIQDMILRGATNIPDDVSLTEKPMTWNKPRGHKIIPESVLNVSFVKPQKQKRKKGPVQLKSCPLKVCVKDSVTTTEHDQLEKMANTLKKIHPRISFAYYFDNYNKDPELTTHALQSAGLPNKDVNPQEQATQPQSLPEPLPHSNALTANILLSQPPIYTEEWSTFDFGEAAQLEETTREQARCQSWFTARKLRFTASHFSELVKRHKPVNLEYFLKFWKQIDLSHVASIRHGRQFEEHVKNLYQRQTRNTLFQCGLVVHPYAPYLGASPDGIVYDHETGAYGVLEVKCPAGKKFSSLDQAMKTKNFYLVNDENNGPHLKRHHQHYYQIQGQMLLCGLEWGDFCVYFHETGELVVERIYFDEQLCLEMYKKLYEMYTMYLELQSINV